MENNKVLLDSYALQKDMRIRLPKQILTNLPAQIGDVFNIYIDPAKKEIILRLAPSEKASAESNNNLYEEL